MNNSKDRIKGKGTISVTEELNNIKMFKTVNIVHFQ